MTHLLSILGGSSVRIALTNTCQPDESGGVNNTRLHSHILIVAPEPGNSLLNTRHLQDTASLFSQPQPHPNPKDAPFSHTRRRGGISARIMTRTEFRSALRNLAFLAFCCTSGILAAAGVYVVHGGSSEASKSFSMQVVHARLPNYSGPDHVDCRKLGRA